MDRSSHSISTYYKMTQVNRSRTGKVTFEIPTNIYLTSWSRNPNINAQLTLKDSAGSEVKFTSDATGKFELGKLNEGDTLMRL